MAKLDPDDAIQAYDNLINKMLKEAKIVLYEQTDFLQAYSLFAEILEIDCNNIDARFGRIVSLLYMSKLRRSRFLDSALMIKEESAIIFHKAAYYEKYEKFLKEINHAIDDYHVNLKKKLTFKNYFYDDECIKLFFKRDQEIGEFKKFLLEEATWLNSKNECPELEAFLLDLEKSIKENEKEINSKLIALDGYSYGLAGYSNDGTSLLGHSSKPHDIKIKHAPKRTLGNNDRKTKVIKDDVYRDSIRLYGFANQAPIWIILNALFAAGAIVCFFAIKTRPFDLVSAIAAGVFGISAILLGLFMILAKCELKKRRRIIRGDGKKVS